MSLAAKGGPPTSVPLTRNWQLTSHRPADWLEAVIRKFCATAGRTKRGKQKLNGNFSARRYNSYLQQIPKLPDHGGVRSTVEARNVRDDPRPGLGRTSPRRFQRSKTGGVRPAQFAQPQRHSRVHPKSGS